MDDIYKDLPFKLHEFKGLPVQGDWVNVSVQRVPGGWNYIYTLVDDKDRTVMSTQFVRWHDSGRLIESGDNYSELKVKLKKAEAALVDIQIENSLTKPKNACIEHILYDYELKQIDLAKSDKK